MPGTTSRGIVFPVVGDTLTPLETWFATLASSANSAMDSLISSTNYAVAADIIAGTSTTKLATPKSLADAGIYAGDTGWVNIAGNVAAPSGFAKAATFTCEARRIGASVYLRMNFIQKNAGNPVLNIGVTGNVANTTILTGIPTQFRPTVPWAAIVSGPSGRSNTYYVTPDGEIVLSAMTPAANQTGTVACPTGEGFSCVGMYLAV